MFRNFHLRAQFNREKPPSSTGSGTSEVKDKTGKDVDAVEAPPIELKLEKIKTTDKWGAEFDDDDFAPLLGEKAHIYIKITNLPNGVKRKLQVDIGRKTKTAVAIVAEVTKDVTGTGSPITEKVVWDGIATKAVARQLSDHKTKDHNTGSKVHIPMEKIASGKEVTHGLYVIDQITLLDGTTEVKKLKPVDKGMSVPTIVNLTFNAKWIDDLKAFGLEPFSDKLKTALRCFGDRDYMINDATVTNRINARYVIDGGTSKTNSITVSIGGASTGTSLGTTPAGPRPLVDNIFAIGPGLGGDINVFPSTFMAFNKYGAVADKTEFQGAYSPLGVEVAANHRTPGTATTRTIDNTDIANPKVKGACSVVDSGSTTVTIDANGAVTVVSTDPKKVPEKRRKAIQKALNYFVKMIGNTINHEVGHAFGLVSIVKTANKVTIDGTTLTSPLDGDAGAHNKATNDTNIMDSGGTRTFKRRVEATGKQQKFLGASATYMRECIPFDPQDD